MLRMSLLVALALTSGPALAQSCEQEVGKELASTYVDQCLEVSPATHPPCNAENSCELIQNEIARGCAIINNEAPEDLPDFCAEYLPSE
jgi:hypothetical protein